MLALAATATAGGAARAEGAGERAAKEATTASLRRAVRTATVLLAARAAQAMNARTPPGSMPMAVFVGPVATAPGVDAAALDAAGAAQGAAAVRYYFAQAATLHDMIADFAGAAISGDSGDAIFAVHAGNRRRTRGSSPAAPPSEDAEREMARKASADYLIEASLQTIIGDRVGDKSLGENSGSGSSGSPDAVRLALRLVDARDGTVVCASDTALPDVSMGATDGKTDRKKG